MSSRPDLREIASNVRDAFADADRDTLLDVLTFVIKEYVVEGPPPMMIHQAENLADLKGATFAQLIAALQTRFDHAELANLVVDGDQVSVRVGGVVQPLTGARQPPGAPATADLPRPAAGVRVVESAQPMPRPANAAPAPTASAPPPVRGLSMRGSPLQPPGAGPSGSLPNQPAGSAQAAAAAAAGSAAPSSANAPGVHAAPPPTPAPAAPPANDKPDSTSGDDASARFSLLELD